MTNSEVKYDVAYEVNYDHCKGCETSPMLTWVKLPSEEMVEIARPVTETGYFPLYEWDHGHFRFNPPSNTHVDKSRRKPLKEFLKLQGRFKHIIDAEIKVLKREVDELLTR